MRKIEITTAVAAAVLAISMPANAQGQGRGNGGIPPGQRPPSGMCRIWIDGVPPGHQPAPTDCVTAERRRPANARVIYGDNTQRDIRRDVFPTTGSVVTIDGRQCVRRDDRNGNVIYRCPNGDYDSRGVRLPDRSGVYGRDGVYDQRDGVYRRDNGDDDRDRVYRRDNDDENRDRVYGRNDDDDDRSGKKLKANKSKHGKGKGKGRD
jgi:hypothetical protein